MPNGKPHQKARFEKPDIYPDRFNVSDEKVSWDVPYPEYNPPYFVSPQTRANDRTVNPSGWADPEDVHQIGRTIISYEGELQYTKTGLPLNPKGRAGIAGRGLLGKWGPNFAADPVVTRVNPDTGELELLAVQRADTGHWAIPGGMVDFGEDVSNTLVRELEEETGIHLDMSDAHEVYRGYVDDRRTTDHAWIETLAKHTHLSSQDALRVGELRSSEEGLPQWLPLTKESIANLYASHGFVVARSIEHFFQEEKDTLSPEVLSQVKSLLEKR